MRRREFLRSAAAGALLGFRQPACAATGVIRIGCAVSIANVRSNPVYLAFEKRLAELGYREGENVALDYVKVKDGSAEEQERGFREAVARGADMLLTAGPEYSLKAALVASQTLPIVMLAIDFDPIERGYVTGLSEPGGRITGVFLRQIELAVKRLHFLRDNLSDFRAAIVFYDDASRDQWEAVERAGRQLAIRLFGVELKTPLDYDRALASVPPEDRKFLFVLASPRFFANREAQAKFALRKGLTSMFGFRQYVEAGGMMSYGPSLTEMGRRAAELAARIARGAKPGDLPVEQPTKFEFVVNLATARSLGVELPPTLLAAADEVIE
jgi:putative tryptophan/tyrosine transport system substrate-binding protein